MVSTISSDDYRDLAVALADEYYNIYLIWPEKDIMDVIKLNGYITEGMTHTSKGLCYSEIIKTHQRDRVHPDDREMFQESFSSDHLIKALSSQTVFHGRYRALEKGAVRYIGYKFVKVSHEGEPLRVIGAFRNIDQEVEKYNKHLSEMESMRQIMASSDMGTWRITLVEGCKPRMSVDEKMRELLGISQDGNLSEEDIYTEWFSRIDVNAVDSVNQSVEKMLLGQRDENTYRWWHPTKGERYVRCGGTSIDIQSGHILSGYHYDVTEQVKYEIRSKLIIGSLAQSYSLLSYFSLENGTILSSARNIDKNGMGKDVNPGDDVRETIRLACWHIVHPEFREEMLAFSDLSTIEQRMEGRSSISRQFKDRNEVWYEWSYILAERNQDGTIRHLLLAIRMIDDEKQAEIRKQRMLEDNIAANKAKTVFLQNMSHEIRTPLNAMFGFAQLLGLPDGYWTSEEKEQYNSYIHNSFNMLDMLIGDIIDIADSEHGNYRINISEVNINQVCRNALMSVEYRVPSEVKAYFTTELPDDYSIQSDGRRIQQVLINYLTNACKYTQKGEIHLHCSSSEHPGKLTFSVTDTGKGVPADKADIIFNRFIKLNNYVQGSGLGLNICQMVATKLGGEVFLDKNYTNGARFVFVL